MFSLGKKEAIINSESKYAPTVSSSLLTIKGFGAFEGNYLASATAQRFKASRNEVLSFTAPDAAALGVVTGEINVPVIVHIRVNTSRYNSEWATDFIRRGRPFIFEILVNAGETAEQVMNKLVAMFTSYTERFNLSARGLPFSWAQSTSSVTLTLKDYYLSFQNNVEFLPRGLTYGVRAVSAQYVSNGTVGIAGPSTTVTLLTGTTAVMKVGDKVTLSGVTDPVTVTDITSSTAFVVDTAVTTTAGAVTLEQLAADPVWDGKYLEENVRMSLPTTSDSYAVSPDEDPIIADGYTSVTLDFLIPAEDGLDASYKAHAFLGTTRGEVTGPRKVTFTLYFLEGTTLFDAGKHVETIMAWVEAYSPSLTMNIANGNTVSTVADFLTNTY